MGQEVGIVTTQCLPNAKGGVTSTNSPKHSPAPPVRKQGRNSNLSGGGVRDIAVSGSTGKRNEWAV